MVPLHTSFSTNSLPLCISPWVVYCSYSILDCDYVYCVAFVCDWCDNVEIIGKNPHIVLYLRGTMVFFLQMSWLAMDFTKLWKSVMHQQPTKTNNFFRQLHTSQPFPKFGKLQCMHIICSPMLHGSRAFIL